LLSGVRITADVVNNSLLIFASEENYAIIERAVQQIDRPQLQVAIDATIAEVTLTNDLNYGVQFFSDQPQSRTAGRCRLSPQHELARSARGRCQRRRRLAHHPRVSRI
jgi:type II secretory pathway component HofQ